MRTSIVIVTLLAVLLCAGCSEREQVVAIQRLEQKMATLEAEREVRNAAIDAALARLTAATEQAATNINLLGFAVEKDFNGLRQEMQFEVAAQFEVFARTNRAQMPALAAQVRAGGLPVQQPAMKMGVPAAVYDRIAAEAAREWPGNYRMQSFEITTQVEAYLKLHGVR